MYNIAVLEISRYIKIGDTMKMGKAGNQHSYFVEKMSTGVLRPKVNNKNRNNK